MSVTIKDVAKSANVSIATVSRVLNNSNIVEEDTKNRVQEAIQELRYLPNNLGRSLSIKRTEAIGLILPDLFGEFFSEVIRGVDQTAQHHKYHLLVSSSHDDRKEVENALQMIRGRVDGLIIMSADIDVQTINKNLPKSLPIVLLNCQVDDVSYDSLNINNYYGAYQMVSHLISHGHKSISIIKGPVSNHDAEERLRGYRQALSDGKTQFDSELEYLGDFSEASGYDAAMAILKKKTRPTAIFAANDSMVIGALSAIQEAGVQVPEEIALAGFDDIPIVQFVKPSLSSVRVSINDLGVLAVNRLIQAIREKTKFIKQKTLVPVEVIPRESCGCPKPTRIPFYRTISN
jgi:LacI family transcriptional regulator